MILELSFGIPLRGMCKKCLSGILLWCQWRCAGGALALL